jgi:hypothetical protein
MRTPSLVPARFRAIAAGHRHMRAVDANDGFAC